MEDRFLMSRLVRDERHPGHCLLTKFSPWLTNIRLSSHSSFSSPNHSNISSNSSSNCSILNITISRNSRSLDRAVQLEAAWPANWECPAPSKTLSCFKATFARFLVLARKYFDR